VSHLRRYLEASGELSAERLQAASRRQQIYGGSFDTVLLELDLLSPGAVMDAVSRSTRLPAAPAALLSARPRPWSRIPQELLDHGWVVPLAEDGARLVVAVHPDLPDDRLGALYRAVSDVTVTVVPECVMARLLVERTGGVVPQRYASLGARFLGPSGGAPAPAASMPATPRAPTPRAFAPAPPPPRPAAAPPPRRFDASGWPAARAASLAVLATAADRDAVIEALGAALRSIADRAVVFVAKSDGLVLVFGHGGDLPAQAAQHPTLARFGAVERVLAGDDSIERLEDLDLRLLLGREDAVPCLFLPVPVRGRVVLVAYVDRDGLAFAPSERADLAGLCRDTGGALERILLARRGGPPAPTAVAEAPTAAAGSAAAPPIRLPPLRRPGAGLLPSAAPVPAAPAQAVATLPPLVRMDLSPPEAATSATPAPAEPPGRTTQLRMPVFEPPARGAAPAATAPATAPQPSPAPAAPPPLRFAPPGSASQSGEGILLSQAVNSGLRRRIILDEEDVHRDPAVPASDSLEARIDHVLDEIIQREGNSTSDLRAFGAEGLLRLAARFPGPLEVLRRDLNALPPPSAHGPLLRAALHLGRDFTPYLLELVDHRDPEIRFYAAFTFLQLRDERCIPALGPLAFDSSADVRVIAMRVLETYARTPGFAASVARVRESLTSENRTRQLHAARAVGTLRDADAVPDLIRLLSHRDRFVQEAALESLCSITGQQHGLKPHRWTAWWEGNAHRHRIEWIIDSLRHKDVPVRRWASDELTRLTGHRVPASPTGDKREAEACVTQWVEWWDTGGRHRFESRG
jgi:hypothetical protein